jgi:hypothetical protein
MEQRTHTHTQTPSDRQTSHETERQNKKTKKIMMEIPYRYINR